MEVLPRVMYIGFLNNIDGFPSDKKCENKNLFEEIYIKIKKNPDELAIQKMCTLLLIMERHCALLILLSLEHTIYFLQIISNVEIFILLKCLCITSYILNYLSLR